MIEIATEAIFYTSGKIYYVRNELKLHRHPHDIQGIYLEVNLRKTRWLLLATYDPVSQDDKYFFDEVGKSLNKYRQIYNEFLLIGDFSAEKT